ncbi:MAG: 30S ribosomal protein S17 [bacterium]
MTAKEKGNKKVLSGTVVNDSLDKTVKVRVERKLRHARYDKLIKNVKNQLAHDEDNAYKVGDVVKICECAPVSKRKRWYVAGKVEK